MKLHSRLVNFTILIVFMLFESALSDIPVHCRSVSVPGKWSFKITAPKVKEQYIIDDTLCGHNRPTHESSAFKVNNLDKNTVTTHTAELLNDHTVKFNDLFKGKILNWTMVYDEGISITHAKNDIASSISFFAFFKYEKNENNGWNSYCYQTLVGWYHEGNKWGCFIAEKDVGDKLNQPTIYEDENVSVKKIVTQGSIVEANKMRFAQDRLTFHSESRNHVEFVNHFNSLERSWKAEAYTEFEGKTLVEIKEQLKNGKLQINRKSPKNEDKFVYVDSISTKRNLELMNQARSQGMCGSCFLLSTLSMIEARLKINSLSKSNISKDKKFSLSEHYVLECSSENQACDGGYPNLVMKFANEKSLLTKECYKQNGGCKSTCEGNNGRIIIEDYEYIGGYYGYTGDDLIKLIEAELENGPMVTSLDPKGEFTFYKSGIIDENIEKPPKKDWVKVDHSVTLIGYGKAFKKISNKEGEEKLELVGDYWLIQNTWGPGWGINGNFRIAKGKNLYGIESMVEWGKPKFASDIVNQFSKNTKKLRKNIST